MPEHVELLEKFVQTETGFKTSIKNPDLKMGIIPSVSIKAENFSIINDDNSKALTIDKPIINIRLVPLLFKNINIKTFSAENLQANLVFDKNSKLKLGQYEIENLPASPFKLQHLSAKLDFYNINLDDKLQKKKINLDGNLYINDYTNGKHIDLSTQGHLDSGLKKAFYKTDLNLKLPVNKISDNQLEISGHIINLDLSDFSIYAKSLSKNKIKSMSGIVNLTAQTNSAQNKHKQIKTNIYLKNLAILKEDISSSIYHKGKLEILTDINTISNGIEINSAKISGDGIDILTSGKITKLDAKIPNLDLKIGLNNSKAEKIIPLLPGEADICPDINLLLLKQTGFWGDASASLSLIGKADLPRVYGNVLVKNAYMVKPIPDAEKAIIKLIFKGDKFDIDVKVPTSRTQTVWVKGPVNLDRERSADLMITSTESVDLKTAQIVLNPLHQILHFDLGPVPIMDIRGKGGIDLHVTGTRKNPHGWGKFWFKDAIVSFLDINNLVVKNGSGTLDFDNQNTLFQTKSAYVNGKPISIKGTCSLLGVLDFDVLANNQDLGALLKTVKTSPMLADIQKMLESIENASGAANFKLNLTGQVKDVNDIVFNKNIFAKGSVELLSNTFKIKGMPILKTSGLINFKNLDADFKFQSALNSSRINIAGKIKNNICSTQIISNRFNISDGIKALGVNIPYDLSSIYTSFSAKYDGKIDDIEYNKISAKGKIHSNKGAKSQIIVNDSNFELSNSVFKLPILKGTFKNSPFNISLNISKVFDNNRIVNGNCKINSFDLNFIHDLHAIIPAQSAKQLQDFEFPNGNINLSARIVNNNLNAFSILDNVTLVYKPQKIKLTIKSGNVLLKNNILNLNKINAQLGEMPLFIDGKIVDVQKNPNLNIYVNAKPSQDFFDQFVNNKSVYPIKIKGDAILSSKISGTADNLNTKSILNLAEKSIIYYMGASIGDIENAVKISLDNTYKPNQIKINNLRYDKIINSQNNKPFVKTQLLASGILTMLDKNTVGFHNFKIKTLNPTDAKIFNIIFRKPFMKQGVFTSDLTLNGTSINPKINGLFNITSIDIPFLDTLVQDVNLDFKNDKIYIKSKGTVLTNEVNIIAVMKNKLVPPYTIENLHLKLSDLNVNKILDTMRDIEADSTNKPSTGNLSSAQNFDITQLIINNADIEADKINVRNINADNFTAKLKLTEKMLLDITNFKFDIAQGSVLGNLQYNLLSRKTNLDVHLNDANALIMSEALFDLKGQVYGLVNGDFNLVCNGISQEKCFNTLSGNGQFKISDGRMPKLGSLEYLLKAGNLIKSGLTGLSINSIIDLITPLKTGNFESISGDINLKNGIADNINIYSSGNDLNMYMTGSYNIGTSVADMQIYGSLSKNITTVFGKIKNASLNTLFNTIPGVNNSNETLLMQTGINKIPNIKNATDIYRIFAVDVNGDINGENYVTSFKWVK